MNYSLICDLFPQLEYLFGCYMTRFAAAARLQPHQVIKAFAVSRPQVAEAAIRQLNRLIQYCGIQPEPRVTAHQFLSILVCPYEPKNALEWFGAVCEILASFPGEHEQSRSHEGVEEPLSHFLGFDNFNAPDLPLNSPTVLQESCRHLEYFESVAQMPALCLKNVSLLDCEVRLGIIQPPPSQPLPLLEAPFS